MNVNIVLHWHGITVSLWTSILIHILNISLLRIHDRFILLNWSDSLNGRRNNSFMMNYTFSVHRNLNLNHTLWPWNLYMD